MAAPQQEGGEWKTVPACVPGDVLTGLERAGDRPYFFFFSQPFWSTVLAMNWPSLHSFRRPLRHRTS